MKTKKIMPPTYMLVAILLMLALNFLFPIVFIIPTTWNLLGIIPIVLSVYISVVAESAFHQAKTTVTPFEESSNLVTSGMYRISRNPMYLGFVVVLIGVVVILRSLAPFIVILVFLAAIQSQFIKIEEQMLAGKFGAQWIAYSKAVRRWI